MTGCSTHWFREKMGLSQKELAEKFDIPIGTVKNRCVFCFNNFIC